MVDVRGKLMRAAGDHVGLALIARALRHTPKIDWEAPLSGEVYNVLWHTHAITQIRRRCVV
jgi:hypothetical protein